MTQPSQFIISRTDSIGDVVLTLPLAGILKKHFPGVPITFLGKSYTRAVIEACPFVDVFMEEAAFLKTKKATWKKGAVILHVFPKKEIAFHARKLGIAWRIGTKSRWYHWLSCNKLLRLKRKKSGLHEAQLNAQLLAPLGIQANYSLPELAAFLDLSRLQPLPVQFQNLLQPGKRHIILHPKSKGSALEWGLENFAELANELDAEQDQIFISGTAGEKELLQPFFERVKAPVTDITGQMTLPEFMAFINSCDVLVANSTGPLHIAAALGKKAVGLYPAIRPMHAGRWAPLGEKAVAISASDSDTGMASIDVKKVLQVLEPS